MTRVRTCLWLTILLPALALAAGETPVAGNTAFALDLYGQLRAQEGNLFLSPHSISTALAMTYGGARGQTAAQMAKALHFELGQDALHPAFAALEAGLAAVQARGKVQMRVANSIWPQKSHPFLPGFLDLCQQHYQTTITALDYAGAAESARSTINSWVAQKTAGKIENLIPSGVLDALTRMVLVNAIYFKGDWASQFKPAATQNQPFRVSGGKTVEARLMHQTGSFGYGESDGLQVLELPYAGNELSMVVLLPRTDGLGELEARLNARSLAEWLRKASPTRVEAYLPKFKLVCQFGLGDKLQALGMTDAFGSKADFSGMDGHTDLYITAVIHKAFVDVNEEGTEAAAATGVVMGVRSVRLEPPPPVFRADHPFLFLIRDNASGAILFLGRVTDPTK